MSELQKEEFESNKLEYKVIFPVSEEIIQELVQFLQNERQRAKDSGDREQMMSTLKLTTNGFLMLKEFAQADPTKSFCVIARDSKQEVLGFATFGMQEENGSDFVHSVYVGVKPNAQKKGIATELVRHANDELGSRGVLKYKVSVWEASRKAFEKASGKPLQKVQGTDQDYIVDIS